MDYATILQMVPRNQAEDNTADLVKMKQYSSSCSNLPITTANNWDLDINQKQHHHLAQSYPEFCVYHNLINDLIIDTNNNNNNNNSGNHSSSNSSKSNSSFSISDTMLKVRRLTHVYDHNDEALLSLRQDDTQSLNIESENVVAPLSEAQLKETIHDTVESKIEAKTVGSSGLTHKESGVKFGDKNYKFPSKAAAILGADESVSNLTGNRMKVAKGTAKHQHALFLDNRIMLNKTKKLSTDSDFGPNKALKQKRKIGIGSEVRGKLVSLLKTGEQSQMSGLASHSVAAGVCSSGVGGGGGISGNTSSALMFPPSSGGGGGGGSLQLKELEKLIRAGKVTLNQIKGWSESFECLLHDKFGLALFHDFLRSEFSDENIEFWIACEEYRTISNGKKLQARAEKIYNDFVGVQAAREVNLDSRTRQQTEVDIQNPTPTTFDSAQKRIQALMDKDSYQRFLRSELYCRLLRLCEQQQQQQQQQHHHVQHSTSPPATASQPIYQHQHSTSSLHQSGSPPAVISTLGMTAHDLSRLTMTTTKMLMITGPTSTTTNAGNNSSSGCSSSSSSGGQKLPVQNKHTTTSNTGGTAICNTTVISSSSSHNTSNTRHGGGGGSSSCTKITNKSNNNNNTTTNTSLTDKGVSTTVTSRAIIPNYNTTTTITPTTTTTTPTPTISTVYPDEPCLPFCKKSLIYSPDKK